MKKNLIKDSCSNPGIINIKTLLIKFIYYTTFAIIFLGMLKVVNQYNNLNGLYTLTRILCLTLCFIYILLFFRKTSNNNIILVILFLIYEIIITIITLSFHLPNGIIDVLLWPMLIIIFYDYALKKDNFRFISNSIVLFYIIILLISSFLISIHLLGNGNGKFGYVIFPTYFSLSTLPLLLKYKNNKLNMIFLILSMIIMLLTTKRTGFLIAIIGTILYYFSSANLADNVNQKLKKYLKMIIIGSLFLIILNLVGGTRIDTILYRFNQLSTDEGSGRIEIWNGVIDAYKNSSIAKQLFGHGTQSVLNNLHPTGRNIFAHNSYLEYLYDYGALGLGILIYFNIKLLNLIKKFKKEKNDSYPSFIYFYVIVVFLSILSYFFEQSYIILPMAIYLGIVIAEEKKIGGNNDKSKYNNSGI